MIIWQIVEGSIVAAESRISITDGTTTEVLSLPPCVDEVGLRMLAQGQCEQRNWELQAAIDAAAL